MDPNANLQSMLSAAATINDIRDRCDEESGEVQEDDRSELEETAFELAELVEAMSDWLKRGGFLPSDWERKGK